MGQKHQHPSFPSPHHAFYKQKSITVRTYSQSVKLDLNLKGRCTVVWGLNVAPFTCTCHPSVMSPPLLCPHCFWNGIMIAFKGVPSIMSQPLFCHIFYANGVWWHKSGFTVLVYRPLCRPTCIWIFQCNKDRFFAHIRAFKNLHYCIQNPYHTNVILFIGSTIRIIIIHFWKLVTKSGNVAKDLKLSFSTSPSCWSPPARIYF